MDTNLVVSIVMPCLNEAETLQACIEEALEALLTNDIAGEVVIADNGSSDGSREIAERAGARVTGDQPGGSCLRSST